MKIECRYESEIFSLSKKIGLNIKSPTIISLNGYLGAGKTTFAKGIIQSTGNKNIISSPTFSIVKQYRNNKLPIFHFDLYRVKERSEMESIGINDYLEKEAIVLIEWFEKSKNKMRNPDLIINFYQKTDLRKVNLYGNTTIGKNIILKLR